MTVIQVPVARVATMYHRLYAHICWTTRDRLPLIDAGVARLLERFLPAVARQERAQVLALGLVTTHVHLLLRLHPTTSVPRLLARLKGGSSSVSATEGHAHVNRPFRWARGYSIASVSERALPIVQEYVLQQVRHHPDQRIPDWEPNTAAIGAAGGDRQTRVCDGAATLVADAEPRL